MPSRRTSEFPQITTIQDTALLLLIQNGINYITTYGNLKDELLLSGEFAPLGDGKIPEEYIPSLQHTQLIGLNDDIYYQHINTAQKLLLSGRGDAIAITNNDIEIPESGTAFLVTGTDDVNSITIDNTHQDSFEFTLIFQSAVTLCNKAVSHAGDVYPVYVAGDVNYATKAGETLKFSFDATGNYVREIGSRSQADVEIDDYIVLTLGVLASEPEEAEEGDTYYNSTSKKVFTYTTAWDAGVTPTANVIYADIVNALNYIWNGTTMQQTSLGTIYIDSTTKKVGINTTKPIERLHVVGNTLLQKLSTTVGNYIAHFFKISTNTYNQGKKGAIAFERTGSHGRGKVHILVENTADTSNADLADKALTVNPDKSVDIVGDLTIGGIAIFSNNPTAWGNSGATMTVTEVSTKINTLTLTDNCELTMPKFTDSVSFMIKVTQDATGGRSLTIKDSDANTMANLSEMDFTTGTANQKCWITVLWDGTEGCYTTSKWI